MLNAHEIYVLGKATVDENREDYYRSTGTDIISRDPEKFISMLDGMIAKLQRVKDFASDYQKTKEEKEKDEPEW